MVNGKPRREVVPRKRMSQPGLRWQRWGMVVYRQSDTGQGAGRPTAAGNVLPDVRDRADASHGGNPTVTPTGAND